MNKNDFLDAVANVDGEILDNVLRKRVKLARGVKQKPSVLMRIVPIAAAIAILAACIVGAFSMANRNKPEVPGADEPAVVPPVVDTDTTTESTTTEENPTVTEPDRTNTIVDGAFELEERNGPHVGVGGSFEGRAILNAYSYYLKNEKIYLNVGCAFFDDEFAQKLVTGEASYPDPHPLLGLVNPDPALYCENELFNSKNNYALINGIKGNYLKVYKSEDGIPYFGYKINWYEEYDEESKETIRYGKKEYLYYEELELDFSEIPAGTSGIISICFGWWEEEHGHSGRGVGLFYYVGENGVGFSFYGSEYAKENLEKIENTQNDSTEAEEILYRNPNIEKYK